MSTPKKPVRCTLRTTEKGLGKHEGPPCGEVMELVKTSRAEYLMCPLCDRQPGYRIDLTA